MTKYFQHILFVILLMPFLGCDTESNSDPRFEDYFIKYYGGDGNQIGVKVLEYNEGFILLGENTLINRNTQLLVVNTDNLGNEIWSSTYGDNSEFDAIDIAIDQDNNIVVAGNIEDASGFNDIIFYKIGADGSKIDSLVYGQVNFDESAADLTVTQNNDYIITGSTSNVDIAKADYNPITDFEDILSIRVTSDLTLFEEANWRRVYGFSGIDRGQGLVQKVDGSFLFFGTTDRLPPGTPITADPELNIFVFPAGPDGIVTSTSPFQWLGSTEADEIAASISKTSNEGFVLTGTSFQSNLTSNIYIAALRNDDGLAFSANVNSATNVQSTSVIEDRQGGFLISGLEVADNSTDIFLMKTSNSGVTEWIQTFGGSDNDLPGSLIQTLDGSILFTGTVELESQTKMTLIKTKPNGELKP